MATCKADCERCIHFEVCGRYYIDEDYACDYFKDKSRFVEVCRCAECKFATELDKRCEINRTIYRHCSLLRGDETRNVWHKYKKYYKDYSLVEADDYCSCGERRSEE